MWVKVTSIDLGMIYLTYSTPKFQYLLQSENSANILHGLTHFRSGNVILYEELRWCKPAAGMLNIVTSGKKLQHFLISAIHSWISHNFWKMDTKTEKFAGKNIIFEARECNVIYMLLSLLVKWINWTFNTILRSIYDCCSKIKVLFSYGLLKITMGDSAKKST